MREAGTGPEHLKHQLGKACSGADPLWQRRWIVVLGLVVLYVVAARLGLLLALPPEKKATAVWVPSGIALAAVLLHGPRLWPGIWLGAFLANLWDFFNPANDHSLAAHVAVSCGIATGSTLQALAGRVLLRRWAGPGMPFERTSTAFVYAGVAMVMCLVAATFGIASLYLGGFASAPALGFIWWTWWLGDMTGVLTAGSLILAWSRLPTFALEPRPLAEAALLLVLVALLGVVIFGLGPLAMHVPPPLAYLTIPVLVWATFRFGLHGATTTLFLISGIAVLGTSQGTGPFAAPTVSASLMLLQVYMGVIAVTALVMAAMLNERQAAEAKVTERTVELEQRASELRSQTRLMESILNSMGEGVIVADENGKFLVFNPVGEKMLGTGVTDSPPAEWSQAYHIFTSDGQTPYPAHLLPMAMAIRAEPTNEGELVIRNPQRSADIYLSCTGRPLHSDEGAVSGGVVVFHDITERKRDEEALRASEARFRRVVEAAPNGMIMVDGTGTITLANAHLKKLFGYDQGELVGQPVELLVPERFRARHPDHRASFFADPQSRAMGAGRDLFGRRQDGTEFPVEIGLNPLETLEGPCVLASIIDITERKHHEKTMRRSLEDKELLLKEIHHRVKNNLQIVSTLLDLQSGHTSDPQALAMFKESRGRVRSMALIHARLYRSPDLARVDFAEYIRQLADDLYRTYKVSGDEIVLEVDVDVPPLPIDIAIPCGLLINELMSNALKHAFADATEGRLRVALHRNDDNNNVLIVADTGAGFPGGLDFRNTTSFGLQLVNTLVEQLNGEIALKTDRGTEFTVTFPVML